MDHPEAVRSNAAERYAIGDLPLMEVEEFERHFFECPQCSEELRALSVLVTNARAVFSEPVMAATSVFQPAAEPPIVAAEPATVQPGFAGKVRADKVKAWWREPWVLGPAFAALSVIAFVSADPALHPASKIEQVSAFPVFAASRGEETLVTPSGNSAAFMLYMDKHWEGSSESYRGEILDETSNAQRASLAVKDPGPGRFLEVKIPTQALTPGRYVLSVKDGDKEVARYPFTLRLN
jgi:hypothetical protein